MADIGSLIVKIGADASGLEKAFTQLTGSAQQFQRGLEKIGEIGATAFLAAATAAVAMTVVAAKQAEELEFLSTITGINTDQMQVYEVMLSRVGLTGDDLAVVLKKLSVSFSQAQQGVGTAGDRFKQLGINIKEVTDTDDLIKKITTTSAGFADGLQKDAVMSELLGRGWKVLLKAFQDGEAGMAAAATASANLGQTLGTSQIDALKKVDMAIADLMTAMTRFGQQMGTFLGPSVQYVAKLFTDLLAAGSYAFDKLGVYADTFGIYFTHLVLKMKTVGDLLFSTNIFSGAAWTQMASNLDFIDKQADKQVAKLKAAQSAIHAPAAQDTRPQVPAFVNSQQESETRIKLLDEELKAKQQAIASQETMDKAYTANRIAGFEAQRQAGVITEYAYAKDKAEAEAQLATVTSANLQTELANYRAFIGQKNAAFADSVKGEKERAVFAVESAMKEKEWVDKVSTAVITANTLKIQSDAAVLAATKATRLVPLQDEITLATADFDLQKAFYASAPAMIGATEAVREKGLQLLEAETVLRRQVIEQTIMDEGRKNTLLIAMDAEVQAKRMNLIMQYPTFFQKQMMDIVSSNAFSVSQIISSWTGGLANAIVNGGKIAVVAWNSTKLAIVQGAINMGVQLAAEWVLQALVQAGIMKAAAVERRSFELLTHTGVEAAKSQISAVADTERTVASTFATKLVASEAIATFGAAGEAMVGIMEAVSVAIGAIFEAMAAALAATVVGIEFAPGFAAAGAAVASGGSAASAIAMGSIASVVAASVAAFAGPGFATGGIGNFGSGTMATLHGPEAIIPLDSRGASFLRSTFGGEGSVIHTHVILNNREIAMAVSNGQPSAFRTMGVL